MFFQRDYILRMIEMMGDLMRRIKELMSDLARMKLLDDACLHHTGISLEVAEGLTPQSLEELLQPVPRLLMSEVLFTRAESFTLPTDEREELLHKSFHLLATLWQEGPLCELRANRLLGLKEEIGYRLDSEELMNAARFFMEAERFADMEDAIFQAAELLPDDMGLEERWGKQRGAQRSGKRGGRRDAHVHAERDNQRGISGEVQQSAQRNGQQGGEQDVQRGAQRDSQQDDKKDTRQSVLRDTQRGTQRDTRLKILCSQGADMLHQAAAAKPQSLALANTTREELLAAAQELHLLVSGSKR